MADDMKLGLFLSSSARDPAALAATAREAERLGFDSLWVPDHVLKVFGPILDPLTLLSFLAGATDRIRLGTGVLVVPYRHPIPLANTLSSLDVLSGGRFVLGAGVGWNEGEFESLGMSVRERGRRTDETLEALKLLWTGEKAGYDGSFYAFRDAEIGTIPSTQGGPPVLVGGYSDAALRRALRFGRGWMGFGDGPGRIAEVRERLASFGPEAGRDPDELELGTTLNVRELDAEIVVAGLRGLAESGVAFCAVSISPADPEALAWLAEEVVPRAGLRLSPASDERGTG